MEKPFRYQKEALTIIGTYAKKIDCQDRFSSLMALNVDTAVSCHESKEKIESFFRPLENMIPDEIFGYENSVQDASQVRLSLQMCWEGNILSSFLELHKFLFS
jgi:hypothetical protein